MNLHSLRSLHTSATSSTHISFFIRPFTLGIFHLAFITNIRNMVEIIPSRLTFPIITGHNISSDTFGGKIYEIASANNSTKLTVDEL